ncbi:hypothetical protein [Amycolatopsis sp. NPDC051102]|uniref:hypothetical protein n=1 Tax=Amycolatopsis sp. NPDC051102 TaxID=3155163 RepID=UPI0034408B57
MSDAPATPAPGSSGPPTPAPPDAPATPDSVEKTDDRLLGEHQRGFADTFRQGSHFLSPEVNQYGAVVSIGRADINALQLGDGTQLSVGQAVSRTSGPVRDKVLTWIRKRYLEVSGYGEMLQALKSNHVLLLRGHPGTGRVTTALHLLDRLTPDRVFRLDSGGTLKSLTETGLPESNAGYVTEVPHRIAGSLTESHLEKLHGLLKAKKA